MTPMCAIQVQVLRSRFDGDVRVFGDFGNAVAIFCTPRGSTPFRSAIEIAEYLEKHSQTILPTDWDEILGMQVPFLIGLNHVSFKFLDCALPPLKAVK